MITSIRVLPVVIARYAVLLEGLVSVAKKAADSRFSYEVLQRQSSYNHMALHCKFFLFFND